MFIKYMYALQLPRLYNFGLVILGFVVATTPYTYRQGLVPMIFLWVPLWLCIYGGLYNLNDYADYETDLAGHKLNNTIVAKILTKKEAVFFAAIRIILGLTLLILFKPDIIGWSLLMIGINVLYSFVIKPKNKYLSSAFISLTGPLKVALGIYLGGGSVLTFGLLFVVHYLCALSFNFIKNEFKNSRFIVPSFIYAMIWATIFVLTLPAIFGGLKNTPNLNWAVILTGFLGVNLSYLYKYNKSFSERLAKLQKRFL